jgi:preprotein translocase subunit SecE
VDGALDGDSEEVETSMRMLRRTPPPAPARPTRPSRTARPSQSRPAEIGKRFTEGISQFIFDTRTELKKVVWPTREQTRNLTVLVIAVSLAVAAFIGAVDLVLQKLFQLILGGA